VELPGFGTFTVRTRRARSGRNPRTGAVVDLSERSFPYFKPGKEIRARLNNQPPYKDSAQ
jgi:integration host factor subunit beta